jgi:hypothetical protein
LIKNDDFIGVNDGEVPSEAAVFWDAGNDQFVLTHLNQRANRTIKLLNATGQLLCNQAIHSSQEAIVSTSGLPGGIYFLLIECSDCHPVNLKCQAIK